MVGVAGKSRACNTCRERRVKCDFGRPSCQRCAASNRICSGYGRSLIFVNRTTSCPSTTATSVLSKLRAQQNQKVVHGEVGTESAESSEVSYLVWRKEAVELLKTKYLPSNTVSNDENAKADGVGCSWVSRLVDLAEPSESLDSSLSAFCLVQLHATGTSDTSFDQCLDQYNIALQHLRHDLNDPRKRVEEETLAAIIVISTCELFMSPTEGSWSVHARGMLDILRLRDPALASTPTWRHLFSRLRVVCILEGLTKQRPQSLDSDIWQQRVPESEFNDAYEEVFDMFVNIPALLERAVILSTVDNRRYFQEESTKVLRLMLLKLTSIKSWLDTFCEPSLTPRYWTTSSQTVNPADIDASNKVFPSSFEFQSLDVAIPIVLCWSVAAQLSSNVIQINNLCRVRFGYDLKLQDILVESDSTSERRANLQVHSSQASSPSSTTPNKEFSILEVQHEGSRMACNVCQSLEYYHRIEMGTFGSQAVTYPKWSARQYFQLHPGHERGLDWLRNINQMKGPGTRWSSLMMTFADAQPLDGITR